METIYLSEDKNSINRVFANIPNKVIFNKKELIESNLRDVKYIFSTWGMPSFSSEEIQQYLPNLKAIFYAAGTVKNFAEPFLNLGIKVFSAWKANAIPVVEYSVSQILLANKGYFHLSRYTKQNYLKSKELSAKFNGNYNAKIGILGYGAIGSKVVKELLKHKADIYVYAPNISDKKAKKLGIHKVDISYIFNECDVISNHMANVPETQKIINENLIYKMKPYTTLINTGRGAQIDEDALFDRLCNDNTITAVLDVTDPEPPQQNSKLLSLDNVIITPHIAGSMGNEIQRMADYMIDEYNRLISGKKNKYNITLNMLKIMG